MKTRIPVAAALLLAAVQFAHADTIQFLGVPTGVNDGQYYDLPYQIAIDGTADLVSCYDIFDDVNFGDVWNANLLTVTQAASTGYFSKDANALAGYERIAWLDAQSYQTVAEQIGLQYAIWNVFGVAQTSAAALDYEAQADAAAATGYSGFSFSNVRFIEQVGAISGQPGTEQAFVYWQSPPALGLSSQSGAVTPEPPTALLFFSCFLITGVAVFFRTSQCAAGFW
jgi:hypothetical protein